MICGFVDVRDVEEIHFIVVVVRIVVVVVVDCGSNGSRAVHFTSQNKNDIFYF